ncbi:MAG: hypothetical protein ACI8UC_000937 [Psychromonas sp.]|jgi:hypothetical protein
MEERLGSYFEPLGPAGKMLESLKAGCQKAMPAHTPGTEPSGSAVVLLSSVLIIFNRMFLQNIAPPKGAVPKGKVYTYSRNWAFRLGCRWGFFFLGVRSLCVLGGEEYNPFLRNNFLLLILVDYVQIRW